MHSPRAESSPVACVIGDSLVNNLDAKTVGNALKAEVVVARAYTTFEEATENEAQVAPKLPGRSFQKVTDDSLKNNESELLILQAGAADITNFKTKDKSANQYREYFKQQTVIAAKNMITVATNSLINYPSLKQVIIMKQVPRYDAISVDPLGTKASLAQLYNDTLVELKSKSSYGSEILICNHNLDCSGGIREARYKSKHRFDGVHLFGSSGSKAFTESILMALKEADLVKNTPLSHFRRYHMKYNQSPQYSVSTHNRFDALNQENY